MKDSELYFLFGLYIVALVIVCGFNHAKWSLGIQDTSIKLRTLRFSVNWLEYLDYFIGVMGCLVMAYGVAFYWFKLFRLESHKLFKRKVICHEREIIHLHMGAYILIGLEMLVAADVIRTVVAPTFDDLTILGVIVLIRTVLAYFLKGELGDHVCEDGGHFEFHKAPSLKHETLMQVHKSLSRENSLVDSNGEDE